MDSKIRTAFDRWTTRNLKAGVRPSLRDAEAFFADSMVDDQIYRLTWPEVCDILRSSNAFDA
jgi:hypothetical protein